MAHEVQTMAYANQVPWHGLGNLLAPNQPLEVWLQQAGMDWSIESSPVHYQGHDHLRQFNDAKVLYRSDTGDALSVVSNRYQVVQPSEVLELYRDLVDIGGDCRCIKGRPQNMGISSYRTGNNAQGK